MSSDKTAPQEKDRISQIFRQTSEIFWKIRSRVTSLQNVLSLLVDYESKKFDAETKDLLVSSRFEVWQLSRYADNLRDFSLLQADELDNLLDHEDVYVKDAVREAIYNLHTYRDNWEKKYFFFDKTPSTIKVRCDKNRLVRIIESLFVNSILYSGQSATVMISTQETNAGGVLIAVKDNGFGIPEADMQGIFANGFRGENAKKSLYQGLGMELYLARKILGKMNGALSFMNNEGAGCTFIVSFEAPVKGQP
jgi:K+-sensing histidine kinase KdpD